ncbi:FAD-dependent oxidoreductase domain-containing protein 1 [Mactra antiquata]
MMQACMRSQNVHKGIETCLSKIVRHLSIGKTLQYSEDREYRAAAGEARSVKDIFKEEFSPLMKGEIHGVESKIPRETDILIIGGGLVGTAVAYFLKAYSSALGSVTVIERDYTYTRASSMLSAGGIRHQFSVPENVLMSKFTSDFLKNYKQHLSVFEQDPPEVSFHHQGYLFLAPLSSAENLENAVKMQRSLGAKTVLLSKEQLAEKYPWLNLDGIEVGSLGTSGEGWFDPWQLVHSLKAKNLANGVRYCEGEVIEFKMEDVRSADGTRKIIKGVDVDCKDGKHYGCNFSCVINCAGPWAGEIARLAHIGDGEQYGDTSNFIELPVEPRKRYVYTFHCPDGPTLDTPFVIDPSGAYFRREGLGGHYICGASPNDSEEPNIEDLNVDYDFYNEVVWPALANRVPAFNNSKLKAAWAGYYDYNLMDQNLIIGPHPYHTNFLFANGMSGHGVQHALAIGQAIFELIMYGHYKTIDLSRFSFNRFMDDELVIEDAIV